MPTARVVAVAPGSPAAAAGLLPGDELLTLNGEMVRDVIRYQIQADEPRVELEVRRGGLEQLVLVEKDAGAPLGLDLASAVFDQVRTCDNHCPFCFIYQLPPGMRKSLSLKDDDYRLSFLYGNFTTLTRFTEADLERVVTEQLSPLYVSIHATDPDLRARLLRNRRGATSLRWLSALLDAGIEVHGQVVVCPGINDGDVLDDTLLGVLDRFPALATLGVVPLGVSDHTTEPEMRPHTRAEAERVLDVVGAWQERFAAALGRRLVYASDEYYLLADRTFPALDAYDDLAQHENGIGMASQFAREVRAELTGDDVTTHGTRTGFFAWVDGAPAEGYRAPRTTESATDSARPADSVTDSLTDSVTESVTESVRRELWTLVQSPAPITILTGEYGARVLEPVVAELAAVAPAPLRVQPVANRFFGGNIAVTGLLTGPDVARVLEAAPPGERFLLPDVVLSNGRFLDGTTPADLPRPVELVPTDGAALVRAIRS
jgi:putative radical SAM enzyme (TIGR03279 family)